MLSIRHVAVCSALAGLAVAPPPARGGAPTSELVKLRMSEYQKGMRRDFTLR